VFRLKQVTPAREGVAERHSRARGTLLDGNYSVRASTKPW